MPFVYLPPIPLNQALYHATAFFFGFCWVFWRDNSQQLQNCSFTFGTQEFREYVPTYVPVDLPVCSRCSILKGWATGKQPKSLKNSPNPWKTAQIPGKQPSYIWKTKPQGGQICTALIRCVVRWLLCALNHWNKSLRKIRVSRGGMLSHRCQPASNWRFTRKNPRKMLS